MGGRPQGSPDTEGHLFQYKLLSASPLIRWDVPHTAHAHSNQFIYRLQTEMTSWFNLIVSNRIIHENKLPKWGYSVPKSFNNDGNHRNDVSLYYFIIGLNPCICQLGLLLEGPSLFPDWRTAASGSRRQLPLALVVAIALQGQRREGQGPIPPANTHSITWCNLIFQQKMQHALYVGPLSPTFLRWWTAIVTQDNLKGIVWSSSMSCLVSYQ